VRIERLENSVDEAIAAAPFTDCTSRWISTYEAEADYAIL